MLLDIMKIIINTSFSCYKNIKTTTLKPKIENHNWFNDFPEVENLSMSS